jgi:hypothetical protein
MVLSLQAFGQWTIERVDTLGNVGQFTSLALDASGYPHVSYFDASATALKYAYKDISGWHLEVADNSGDVGRHTGLALDPSGVPHVSYSDVTAFVYDLKYANRIGAVWNTEIAEDRDAAVTHTAIALEGTIPHISYSAAVSMGDSDLRYAWKVGTWSMETVDTEVGTNTSIAVDGSGVPHISYFGNGLRYAYKPGPSWNIQTVDAATGAGQGTSIALDTGGDPHIAYFDSDDSDLEYVYWNGTSWTFETVDSNGVVGQYPSLALGTGDFPHISYYDGNTGNLKYAYKDAGGWHTETADPSVNDVGLHTSIAVIGGYPRITYYDNTLDILMYAYKDAHDAGVVSIDMPVDTVCIDSTYAPSATVGNFGTSIETFDVSITIDGYTDTVTVSNLGVGASVQVFFTNWVVPNIPGVTYGIDVCTHLVGDAAPGNDCVSDSLDAIQCELIHDGSVLDIASPPDTVCFGGTYSPCALVVNLGNTVETFDVILTGLGGAPETLTVSNLGIGQDTLVCFSDWLVPTTSDTTYNMTICTDVVGDVNPANDCLAQPIFAHMCPFHDGGVVSIDTPPDTVCTDSTYTPCATVQNYGNIMAETLMVRLTLGALIDSVEVVLDAGMSEQVCFSDWIVPPAPANYRMDVMTEVNGDTNFINDMMGKDIVSIICIPGVEEGMRSHLTPAVFGLSESNPNPFRSTTSVSFQLPVPASVSLRVYDAAGRPVRTLADGSRNAGYYSAVWDGTDDSGVRLPSGIYFYGLTARAEADRKDFRAAGKIVLMQR